MVDDDEEVVAPNPFYEQTKKANISTFGIIEWRPIYDKERIRKLNFKGTLLDTYSQGLIAVTQSQDGRGAHARWLEPMSPIQGTQMRLMLMLMLKVSWRGMAKIVCVSVTWAGVPMSMSVMMTVSWCLDGQRG